MKVLMINGSRREKGCTYTGLEIIAKELKAQGIESEILFIGDKVLDGRMDETVKEATEKMKEADGIVIGSPVYYASPSGEVLAFLDRFWGAAGQYLVRKPGAVITSARRGGTTASLDVLNKYLSYAQMPIVSSNYWNMIHGNSPEEVLKDAEGVQIMETLGRNMAWILKCIEAGKNNGVEEPVSEKKIFTNFIK